MNRTLLLVAYHYPPENAIGGARPARFVKYLPEAGWDCQIFTAAPQTQVQHNVHFVEDHTRGLWGDGVCPNSKVPAIRKYSELALRRFFFSGMPGLTWWRDASAAATRLVRQSVQTPEAVLSTFPPLPTHLAGRRLARTLGVPWIADYRDPFPHQVLTGMSRLSAMMYQAIESRFFREADAIILNTEAMAEMYRVRYPNHAGKMHVIWNGFDPEDLVKPLVVPRRPSRILSHVGTLYSGRNPVAILESLERLRAAGDAEALRCKIQLAGPNFSSPREQEVLDRCTAAGWVDVKNALLPQAEARQLALEADGLLLLQPQSGIQVPGKTFEYLRTGRPILSLAPLNSPIEWILNRSGIRHTCLYPDDPPGETDHKLREFLCGDWGTGAPNEWFEMNFNAAHQVHQLTEILNRVVSVGCS